MRGHQDDYRSLLGSYGHVGAQETLTPWWEQIVSVNAWPFLRVWLGFFAIFVALGSTWSLASPVPSGPDEPAQYINAAAVAHGSVLGKAVPGHNLQSTTSVRVPQGVSRIYNYGGCYYGRPDVPAGCSPHSVGDGTVGNLTKSVQATTYVGRYPPLYYAIVGIPSLASVTWSGLRVMRLFSVLLGSCFLALAMALARTYARNAWMAIGVGVAITPLSIYLISVVNPSGLEVSAAAATWVAAVILVFQRSSNPPLGLLVGFDVAALGLTFTRPLSPVFVVCIVAATVVMRPKGARALLANKSVQIAAAIAGAGVVGSGIYVLAAKSYEQETFSGYKGSTGHLLAVLIGNIPTYAKGMVGGFGSPELMAPALAILVWLSLTTVLIVGVVRRGSRTDAFWIGIVTVAVLMVLPVAASLADARTNGLLWQGRYQYPLAIGIPVLATACLDKRRPPTPSIIRGAPILVGLGMVATFYWVLRRYVVGTHSLNVLASVPGKWAPPIPVALLLLLGVGAGALYTLALIRTGQSGVGDLRAAGEP